MGNGAIDASSALGWSTRVVSPLQDYFPEVAEALAVASARLVRDDRASFRVAVNETDRRD